MKFAEWASSVPPEIRDDPIWKLEAYQLAVLASEVAERDARVLEQILRMRSVADQLYAAAAAISTNLREGCARGESADRSQFYEYALVSARECREWYETARTALPEVLMKHRLELMASIVGMITSLMPDQRTRSTRDAGNAYEVAVQHEHALFDEDIPFA